MLKSFFGILGSLLPSIYYIISAKSFLNLFKGNKNNLEEIDFYKVLFNYMISFFSYFYSDFSNYSSMIICSKFGIFFCSILLIIYIAFEFRVDLKDAILNILMISIVSFTYYHYFHYILVDEVIFGYDFVFSNLIPLFYLLYTNYFEFKKRINTSFSYYSNIIYTSTAFCWNFYGFLYNDYYIKLTFLIETLFGILLIILHYYYDKVCNDYAGFGNLNNDNSNNMEKDNGNILEFEDERRKKYENI